MNILDLVLKHKWYDAIRVEGKREEYREINGYWVNHLCQKIGDFGNYSIKNFDTVRFHKGYSNVTMTFQITDITIGRGKTEWGAPADRDVFIIKLGGRSEKFRK